MYQLSIGMVPNIEKKSVASEGPSNDSSHSHPNCADQCQVCKKGRMIQITAFDAHGPPIRSSKPNIIAEMKNVSA
jgi:hypothetical protein